VNGYADNNGNLPTWTAKTFTGAGTTGVTLYVTIPNGKLPANTTTFALVKTTGGMNSTSGKFVLGELNGAAFPATWSRIVSNNGQELDLIYTKPG
jgi:hypothetical protein